MGFQVSRINEIKFEDLHSLTNYIEAESKRIVLVPILEFINKKSLFKEDQLFGLGNNYVNFNEEGFKQFCYICKLPYGFINGINEKNLTTSVMNDYISTRVKNLDLHKYNFVLDESSMTVIGVVSNAYYPYSNKRFLEDIFQTFSRLKDEYDLVESFSINTNIYVRLLSKKLEVGIIRGSGGTGIDKSQIGIQLCNSMVGQRYITASYYIYRLICANGLVIQSSEGTGKVRHIGREETFNKRLHENIGPVIERINNIPKLIKSLGDINFDAYKFVKAGGSGSVYKIIPLNSAEQEKRKQLNGTALIDFDTNKVLDYMKKYAGPVYRSQWRENQSMFDFINLFTEYAQQKKIQKRIEIEENSGELVNWILQNKRKFK